MKILIVTDAWYPQVNGVCRTLKNLGDELKKIGHQVEYIEPNQFFTVPMPKYNEIKLSLNVWPRVGKLISKADADIIHIATEGPIGIFAKRYCVKNKLKFTTSYHTQFDKYLKLYYPYLPIKLAQKFLKGFHSKAEKILVTTQSMKDELQEIGFDKDKMVVWTRGANHGAFQKPKKINLEYKRPIYLYVGRVSIEKNIRAFLDLELEGTKLVVGKGPDLDKLKKEYPEAIFKGQRTNGELASYFASSDVFVFPSKTDTFGIVIIEALKCGLPVAAYPVAGPKDIFNGTNIGSLNNDLKKAAIEALKSDRSACIEHAKKYTWENCAKIFLNSAVSNR
jgi:glycosyltransferase involved in cell wall biosynthesis